MTLTPNTTLDLEVVFRDALTGADGAPGAAGATGPAGADGVAGADGADGADGNSAGLYYTFSTTTSMADPGAGILRFNNATPASVTAIAVDDATADSGNPDVSAFVNSWADSTNPTEKGELIIREVGSPENIHIYTVTGVTDNAGWTEVAVTSVNGSGTFANTDSLSVEFYRAGDKGADGGGAGDVTATSVFGADNVVVRADGTGKGVQASGLSIDDSDNLSGINNVTGVDADFVTGTAGTGGNLASWNVDGDLVDAGSATSAFAAASHNHAASDIDSGTLAHERGGLEADVSAYSGLVKITGGATSAVTVTAAGEALLDDADAAAQRTTLGLGTAAVLAEGTSAEFRNNTADRALSTDQVWGAGAEVTLTSSSNSTALDLNSGINFVTTLGENTTLAAPTNEKVGQSGYIRVVQDGTGSWTFSFEATEYFFAGGTAPSVTGTAGAETLLFYVVLAANKVFISAATDVKVP
jgi:hypothetical protein